MRLALVTLTALLLGAPAWAADDEPAANVETVVISDDLASLAPAAEVLGSANGAASAGDPRQNGGTDAQPLHAAAVEHSEAYQTRAKIHKYASFATLPLFAAEVALGQSLYNNPVTGATKSAHIAIGTGIIGLFGVNTVTGAWNMFGEGWEDKDGRTLRLVHGLLMMASDAGFLATWATGPNDRRGGVNFDSNKSTHRAIAFTSVGVGTFSYLLMFFANHH